MEGLARCHLKLNDIDAAEEWARALVINEKNRFFVTFSKRNFFLFQHETSNPTNNDHLNVSLGLLALIHHEKKRFTEEAAAIARVIRYRPFFPDHWIRLYHAYTGMTSPGLEPVPSPFAQKNLEDIRAFCLIRALVLLQTVQKSVQSFSKTKNEAAQTEVTAQVRALKLHPEKADRIQLFASFDIFNRYGDGKEEAEGAVDSDKNPGDDGFEDLGRSARMNAIQKSFENAPSAGQTRDEDADKVLEAFEKQWFAFIEE